MPEVALKVVPPAPASPARQALAEVIERAESLRRQIDGLTAPHDRAEQVLVEEHAANAEVARIVSEIEAEQAAWLCGSTQKRPDDRVAELGAAQARAAAASASAGAARRIQAERREAERALQKELEEVLRQLGQTRLGVLQEEFEVMLAESATARAAAAAADARLFGVIQAAHAVANQHHDAGEEAGRAWSLTAEQLQRRANSAAPAAPLEGAVDDAAMAAGRFLTNLLINPAAEVDAHG